MKTLFKKIRSTLSGALKQGWTPQSVCWSASWGVTIGLFPIYGVTTATLALIGTVWKLNHAVMQAFNYLIAPLKFALILPYIRLGEWVFQTKTPFRLSVSEFSSQFQAAPMQTLSEFAMTFVHAISGWLISVPFWIIFSYFSMQVLLRTGAQTRKHLQEVHS